MADLSRLGGGGGLKTIFFSGQISIPAATPAGELLNIIAPVGKLIRLEALYCNGLANDSNQNNGITLTVDGKNIVSDVALGQGSNGNFCVTQSGFHSYVAGPTSGRAVANALVVKDVIGEQITLSVSVQTSFNTIYSYSILENL